MINRSIEVNIKVSGKTAKNISKTKIPNTTTPESSKNSQKQ